MTVNETHKDRRIIVALDVPDERAAEQLLAKFGDNKPFVKVGMQLFYAAGPSFVHKLKAHGYPVFLDLKLHDIPQTVYLAAQSLARLNVDLTTVHIAGGTEMLRAAVAGVRDIQTEKQATKVIGVTQLTSTNEHVLNEQIGIAGTVAQSVSHYAELAQGAGLNGVVCSGWEVEQLKRGAREDFLAVTPGIRLPEHAHGDQKRVMSPQEAVRRGADYLVIGRSITHADDPRAVYERIGQALTGEA
ncbi:orotidine-5'-phosphate decarboxylase [Numidum massiliense]|uniref:orotidine-5'-phosphate decarboxylase n=1 Tax=Numidum massiliense TaxID=1522315 RepID=UPI0006D56B8E|nr:orotidine-5'-phosphate decarboxylase [Numidum massiliense]